MMSAEHVAGAAGRERGVAGRIDRDAAIRRGDDGARRPSAPPRSRKRAASWRAAAMRSRCTSFTSMPSRRAASSGCGVRMHGSLLPPRAATCGRQFGVARNQIERVGVEQLGHVESQHVRATRPSRDRSPHAAADRERVHLVERKSSTDAASVRDAADRRAGRRRRERRRGPCPRRRKSAMRAARIGAPHMPVSPPTTARLPKVPLLVAKSRGGR